MKETKKVKEYSKKSDIIFKAVFSKKGSEDYLKEFLSSLLKLEIKKIEIEKEVNLAQGKVESKVGAIDLKATLNDNEIVDIEMQRQDNKDIIERTTKYSCDLISSQLIVGEKYTKLKPVIVIAILDYNFLPYKEYINETVTVLKEDRGYEINKYQKYYYIELPKFRKEELELGNKVSEWLTFIDGENKERLERVMVKNKLIKKAQEDYEYLTGDAEKRRWAELERRYYADISSAKSAGFIDGEEKGLKRGIKQGIKAGIQTGEKNASKNIAKSMLIKGFDVAVIADLTDLSIEEVKELK